MAEYITPITPGVQPVVNDPKNREDRRAEKLRENLAKRKRQQRERAQTDAPAETDDDADDMDHRTIDKPTTGGLTDIEV